MRAQAVQASGAAALATRRSSAREGAEGRDQGAAKRVSRAVESMA